ncbi:MAG: 3-hydroxyacyl-CoA dehydrogenase family protein [Actinobacteria bacterium]|nr:MAG: 3-hydroxyacyl-CoA dehydrogenase family protein [Actinomycetota bacterium]
MSYSVPSDIDDRPVVVIGAGTLGARIALMFAAGGSPVRIFNRTPHRATAAKELIDQQVSDVRQSLGLSAPRAGEVEVVTQLDRAVPGAWLVIESIAEDLALKRPLLGEVDRLADPDAVLATNSSSYPSSEMIDEVERPERVLNMHFLMPPQVNPVELMSCGRTDEAIIDALVDRLPRYGLVPFRVQRESVGFIFNRIWAAIKREALMVVAEGAATPEDVDRIWQEVFRSPAVPFRMMDQVGLDVVLDIENHYAAIREGIPEGPRTLLQRYVDRGHLGVKSGRGFYGDYAGAAD